MFFYTGKWDFVALTGFLPIENLLDWFFYCLKKKTAVLVDRW